MDGRDCEYCGYSICECGEAYKPAWRSAAQDPPQEGLHVLWFVPGDHWPIFVGKRDGNSIDGGLDLNEPISRHACWMPLPEPPISRSRKNWST